MLITFICKRAHIQRYSLCCKLLWRCFDELLLHTQPTTIMFFMEATYVRLIDIVLWSVGVKNAVGIVVISHISISRLRTCSHPMSELQRESERERKKPRNGFIPMRARDGLHNNRWKIALLFIFIIFIRNDNRFNRIHYNPCSYEPLYVVCCVRICTLTRIITLLCAFFVDR